jgi:predicted O-linked N-acetylglucosamine transferase (SPINDLY family)
VTKNWEPEVEAWIASENYGAIAQHYEEAIHNAPECPSNYWCLGLAYLLQKDEEAAQTVWFFGLSQFDETTAITELSDILEYAAEAQYGLGRLQLTWLIRRYLLEFQPQDPENILWVVQLLIDLDVFEVNILQDLNLIDNLVQAQDTSPSFELIKVTLAKVVAFPSSEVNAFIKSCASFCNENVPELIHILVMGATSIVYESAPLQYSIELLEFCLALQDDAIEALEHLPRLYGRVGREGDAIQAADRFIHHAKSSTLLFVGYSTLLGALILAGEWNRIPQVAEIYEKALTQLIEENSANLPIVILECAVIYSVNFAYIRDDLAQNRWLHNSLGNLFQKTLQSNVAASFPLFLNSTKKTGDRIKVGYVGYTLRAHSVGWLSRWLFQYHDREKFEISVYLFKQSVQDPFFQRWIAPNVDNANAFGDDVTSLSEKIRDDGVQVLVDLDSLTSCNTSTALLYKPAPVQVTWLGWDAPGLPTVDYFIADPYVLPENAQQYYQERLWRLPNTYLAVKGFEVDVPTLKREDLGIPANAIIYMTSQNGAKRNPSLINAQLQILKEVPGSYLLIKGLSMQERVQQLFIQIADNVGISVDRLKFLPTVSSEYMHRANLGIADVVLDTYPYNGATTTLETIWMGIPLVTKVGTTFSARNSYTFLKNAGVSNGIAWTDEEYVNWGICFGRDEALRRKVSWQMYQSRTDAPLWNVKQFTDDMENAYQQMWHHYCETTE